MSVRCKINSDRWIVEVVSHKEMFKLAGDKDTTGLCDPHERVIYIREDSIDYGTVAHEIFHAHFSYLCLSTTENISLDDAEEISAEFFANKSKEMVKQAKQLTRKLEKLYAEREE